MTQFISPQVTTPQDNHKLILKWEVGTWYLELHNLKSLRRLFVNVTKWMPMAWN